MIRVLIADDHQLFIDGLKALLKHEDDIEVVCEALNGEEVIQLMENYTVDIAIIDIEMPLLNGIETTRYIKTHYPNTKVLILTMYNKKHFILNIMKVGAAGYILKNKSQETLIQAIQTVYRGGTYYGLDVMNKISNERLKEKEIIKLTKKEKEVLCLIAEGMTAKEISFKLSIATTTVDTHKKNLLTKIEVPNDKHLVRYAIKHGYVKL